MPRLSIQHAQRIEQVLVELDISAIEDKIKMILFRKYRYEWGNKNYLKYIIWKSIYVETTLGQSKCRCQAATNCLINLQLIGYSYLKYLK